MSYAQRYKCNIPTSNVNLLPNSRLAEFANNYHHRFSAEWVAMESAGVGTEIPQRNKIYLHTTGLMPHYGGHVPGESFSFGLTYGNSTVDAKRWLALHRDKV